MGRVQNRCAAWQLGVTMLSSPVAAHLRGGFAMTVASAARRRWRPQFSLRSLLLFITVLGLVIPGGVGWWRRPFEVVELASSSDWKHEELLEWEGVPEQKRKTPANKANKVALPT